MNVRDRTEPQVEGPMDVPDSGQVNHGSLGEGVFTGGGCSLTSAIDNNGQSDV